jgi:hypothetical protein
MSTPASALRSASFARAAGRVAAACALVLAGALVAYRFEPTTGLLPCPYLALTGMACPGCGITRAFHFLTHADVTTAFAYNPLLFLAAPAALVFASAPRVAGQVRGARWRTSIGWTMAAVTLAFWVWRNTPWYPLLRL